MATNRISPKKGKVVDIPDAVVTIGTPTAGDAQVSVAFTATAPATGGPVQKYTAISSPGSVTVSGSTSPVVVTGLTNGTAYTFTVAAGNATGNNIFSSASASATPTVTGTFESIATVTIGAGGSGGSISFSSIPQTYKHLQIRAISRYTAGTGLENLAYLQFNGDTATNYAHHFMLGTGSAVASTGQATINKFPLIDSSNNAATANVFAVTVADISDYTNTNKYKTARSIAGLDTNGNGSAFLCSGLWMNTAAITSITVVPENTAFAQYSSFALYGIKG